MCEMLRAPPPALAFKIYVYATEWRGEGGGGNVATHRIKKSSTEFVRIIYKNNSLPSHH